MNRTAFEEILKNDVNHLKGLLQIEGGRFVIEKLESPNKGETSIYRSYSAENVDDLSFKNRLINDFIFRDCDLKAISFINVDFENTIFENCKIEFARFYNCSFTSTKFLNTKIKNTGLGLSYRGSNSMFKDVTFNHCHIEKLGFDSPLFSKCNFEESKIMDVEFNGSVFEDCKFTGKIIDSFFRGVYVHPPQRQAILEVFNKKREYGANKMKNVDFSGAELVGVEFSKGIDLHTCTFPMTNDYMVVHNISVIYPRVVDIINQTFFGEDRRIANSIMDNILYSKVKRSQDIDFVDLKLMRESIGPALSNRIQKTIENELE